MRRPRPRLAFKIYLAGLAQVAAVALGVGLFVRMRIASDAEAAYEARASVEAVAAVLDDPAALARELERVERTEDASITVYDSAGTIRATNRNDGDGYPLPPPPPPFSPPDGRHRGPHGPLGVFSPPGPPMPAFMVPVTLPDGSVGRAVFARRAPRLTRDALVVLALALVVVGVASMITARSLARPLADLSRAARALGDGKLDARLGMVRADEIGDVARAFDEMADRVTTLLRAEKELLANVSHELRTPLARIRVALDLAAEGDADAARSALGEIGEDLGELERLIGDVLAAARLDLGADASAVPPLRRERVEVAELLERAAARFRSAHPERPLRVSIATGAGPLDADPVLLRRVVDNLLENAHRYAKGPDDGVELSSSRRPGEVVIEVRDRGIGISPADLANVFRPFFRADRSRARATGGLGLGLALAKRIVEAHHGSIELESQIGGGTRAHVHLPAAEIDDGA